MIVGLSLHSATEQEKTTLIKSGPLQGKHVHTTPNLHDPFSTALPSASNGLGIIFLVTVSCFPACLTRAMNSGCRLTTRGLKAFTKSRISIPASGMAARTSSRVGKGKLRGGLCARLPVPEGEAAREALGVFSEGEPGGLFLRRILGRPAREVSVSLPEPEPPVVVRLVFAASADVWLAIESDRTYFNAELTGKRASTIGRIRRHCTTVDALDLLPTRLVATKLREIWRSWPFQ